MRLSDFILALPALYVVLALRATLPLVLTAGQVFWTMVIVLSAVGWPVTARVVRSIVLTEGRKEYAEAARALGAGRTRILLRHLLPASAGAIAVQATLLVPAFILAEATLSFVGLGVSEPNSSWGGMLRAAGGGRMLAEAPWLLAPAVAIVAVTLAIPTVILLESFLGFLGFAVKPSLISWGLMLQDTGTFSVIGSYPWILSPVVFVLIAVFAFNALGDGLRDAVDPY